MNNNSDKKAGFPRSGVTATTGRERVLKALNYKKVDRVPVDLGGTPTSGAHVSVIANLRQALGLDKPDEPVKVVEPCQMLGEVTADLREALGLDVVNLSAPKNSFGFENANWKPWQTFDGTNVLVPGKFNTEPEPNGDILQYPQGDKTVPASARMPRGGFYFDAIVRQEPIDETRLNPADNLEEFGLVSDEDLKFYEKQASELYENTDLAIAVALPGMAFGDIARVPAVGKNIERVYQAIGNKVHVVFIDGTDLAAQNTLFCSPETYRELYLPFSRKINDWIAANTEWKSMKHCCGGCEPLIEGFIEAGFDILNPVQTSAKGMAPEFLVEKYGGRIVFWGGGVDTQQTLPFGKPDEVCRQVTERVQIFSRKNGFVFNTIHNIQCNTPVENVLAMFETLGRKV
ncbi:MAG: uroporphyrinogen decarboxylase family protein [Planctomycetota bacterium]|jgi:hypothetical protein